MPSTNKCNLEDDEKLASQVEKYPCLYDKSRDDYKDKGVKETAWQVIDYELGFNQGEAEKKFEILKKRFSRKRIDAKRARMSGPSHYDISTAKKAYEEYSFLSWYEPYIRDKKTSLDVATYDDGILFGRHIGDFDDDDQIEDKLHLPEDSIEVHDDDQYGSDSMTYDAPSFVRKHWVKREVDERRPSSDYQRPGTSRDNGLHTRKQFPQDGSNDDDTNINDNINSMSACITSNSNSRSNSNWNSPSTSCNNSTDDNNHTNTTMTSKSSDHHIVLSSRPISVQLVHKPHVPQGREVVYRNQSSENVEEHMTHEPRADTVLADTACSSPVFNNPGSSRIVDNARPGSHIMPPTTHNKVQPQMSPDEAFGQMIASELSTFDDDLKFLVKNDLNKVIFEYRLKQQQMRRQNGPQ